MPRIDRFPDPPRVLSIPGILVLALAVLLVRVLPAHAQAGTVIWTYQGIEDINVATEIADRDSDGVNDVVIETYDSGAGAGDHLILVSASALGAPPVLWSKKPFGGVSSGGGDGDGCLAISPDLTGDGRDDILLGTAWGGRTAYAFDADTGRVVWDFDTYVDTPPNPATSGWVYQIIPVQDRTGDGVPEVAFACGSENNSGYLVNGATGAVIWQKLFPDAAFTCTTIPQFTNDNEPAVIYGTGDNDGKLYCFVEPTSPTPLWSYDPGGTIWHCTTIPDISGDGLPDVIAATWATTIVALDGRTGANLWTYPLGSGNNGMRVAALDDVNNDEYPDVAAGAWDNAALVISGRSGAQIWKSYTGTLQGGDVWAIDRVADVNGDGVNDVVAGSFDENVWAFDGVTGDTLWTTSGSGRRVFTVRGTSDLTGNTVPDVLSGTQMLSGNGGRARLIEGGDPSPTGIGDPGVAFARSEEGGVRVAWGAHGPGARVEVWRAELAAGERDAVRAKRAPLLAALKNGEMGARDVARAIAAGEDLLFAKSDERFVRVTPAPLDASRAGEYLDAAVVSGTRYAYRLAITGADGRELASPSSEVLFTGRGSAPARLALLPNEPNPFSAGTTIRWDQAQAGRASVAIYNLAGERVRQLVDEARVAGRHQVVWDGRDARGARVASGVYLYRLATPRGGETRSLTIVR